jgi:DNA-binding Lrp family transcriptional regulator
MLQDRLHQRLTALQQQMARRLLAVAILCVREYQRRVGVSAGPVSRRRRRTTTAGPKGSRYTAYTNPSKPGEYPHKRTGLGQMGITFAPQTPEDVLREGLRVRLGVLQNAWYMRFLEVHRQRLGWQQTFRDLLPQIRQLLEVHR